MMHGRQMFRCSDSHARHSPMTLASSQSYIFDASFHLFSTYSRIIYRVPAAISFSDFQSIFSAYRDRPMIAGDAASDLSPRHSPRLHFFSPDNYMAKWLFSSITIFCQSRKLLIGASPNTFSYHFREYGYSPPGSGMILTNYMLLADTLCPLPRRNFRDMPPPLKRFSSLRRELLPKIIIFSYHLLFVPFYGIHGPHSPPDRPAHIFEMAVLYSAFSLCPLDL